MAASPMASNVSPGAPANSSRSAASSATSEGPHSQPVTPGATSSGMSPTRLPRTGSPKAIASRTTAGKDSDSEGMTTASAATHQGLRSPQKGSSRKDLPRRRSAAKRSIACAYSGTASPSITQVRSGRRRWISSSALASNAWPFTGQIDPAQTTSRSCEPTPSRFLQISRSICAL